MSRFVLFALGQEGQTDRTSLLGVPETGAERGVFCQTAIESAQHDHALAVQNALANKEAHLQPGPDRILAFAARCFCVYFPLLLFFGGESITTGNYIILYFYLWWGGEFITTGNYIFLFSRGAKTQMEVICVFFPCVSLAVFLVLVICSWGLCVLCFSLFSRFGPFLAGGRKNNRVVWFTHQRIGTKRFATT